MAGEVMLINPRRRRRRVRNRRRKPRVTAHGRRHRRRIGYRAALVRNPRRRRRVGRRTRRVRHRRHINPRLPFGMNLEAIGYGAAGLVGTHVLGKQLAGMLPATWALDPNLARIGSKAVVGIGGPLLLRRMIGSRISNALAIGGGIAVLVDLISTFAPKEWGLPSLADYQTGVLSDYQQGVLQGYSDPMMSEAVSGSGVYDTSVYS